MVLFLGIPPRFMGRNAVVTPEGELLRRRLNRLYQSIAVSQSREGWLDLGTTVSARDLVDGVHSSRGTAMGWVTAASDMVDRVGIRCVHLLYSMPTS